MPEEDKKLEETKTVERNLSVKTSEANKLTEPEKMETAKIEKKPSVKKSVKKSEQNSIPEIITQDQEKENNPVTKKVSVKKSAASKLEEPKVDSERKDSLDGSSSQSVKKSSIKKPVARDRVPSIAVEQVDQEKRVDTDKKRPSITISDEKRGSIPVIEEPSLERKDSDASSGDGSRRDSLEGLRPLSPRAGRRPSLLIADEKGLAVDESGQTKKLRPGEMLEVRRGSTARRGSIDLRKGSVAEVDKADHPSTPLRAIGDEGPPVITDYVENVQATDGKTAYLQATVEGNPAPQFRFYKDNTEIYDGGRFRVVTDGETNTVYYCIRKAQSRDEGKYKVVAYNVHGEDSCNIKLFVSGKFNCQIVNL